MALPDHFDLNEFVRGTLAEDLGIGGDVTSPPIPRSSASVPRTKSWRSKLSGRAMQRV